MRLNEEELAEAMRNGEPYVLTPEEEEEFALAEVGDVLEGPGFPPQRRRGRTQTYDPLQEISDAELRNQIQIALMAPAEYRIAAAFLGTSAWKQHKQSMSYLRGALMWEALAPYAASREWTMDGVTAMCPRGSMMLRPAFKRDDLGPDGSLVVPQNVMAFVNGGEQCFIVKFTDSDYRRTVDMEIFATCEPSGFLNEWREHARANNSLRGTAIRPSGRPVDSDGAHDWPSLYLAADVKERLQFHFETALEDSGALHAQLGLKQRRGLILHGPPGTGKTLIGKILARQSAQTFIWMTPGDLHEPGDVIELYKLARFLAPAIVLFEDLDIVAEDRNTSARGSLLGELMNQIDGCAGDHSIVTIATTNRLEAVEKALSARPGRFEQVIEIPPPDSLAQRAYLLTRFHGHRIDDADLAWIVKQSAGSTGAVLEELANLVLTLAWRKADRQVNGALVIDRAVLDQAMKLCPGQRTGTLGFEVAS